MSSSKKEEERVERIIRGLLKLPENRRCINCNALGPQYVCTTFSTFVCINCSGLHREFTHRVKSVSMAKFTPEEVTALQAGGNERAKQIYFKGWDPMRHSYPDSSNMHRLRDFIKHVYVERKYTGEISQENLPRIKLNDKEESHESKKGSSFRLELVTPKSSPGARNSPSAIEDASLRYVYDESRSPKYVRKYSRFGGLSKSPMKFEVVDDRFRDEDYRNRRQSNLDSKLGQLSFDGRKSVDRSQAPVQRSSGEITTKNDSSLQVTTSGEEGSIEKKPSEKISNKPRSLNDLSPKSQASETAIVAVQETPSMTMESESNWASFETSTEENVPKTPNTNTIKSCATEPTPKAKTSSHLDLLLLELSGPFSDNVPTTSTVEKASTLDFPSTSMEQTTASCSETAQPSNEIENPIEVSHAHEPQSMQDSPSVSVGCSSTTSPIKSPNNVVSNNEPSFSPNTHETSHAFDELSSRTTSNPTQNTKPDVGSKPSTTKTKSSGRMELPEDLFTTSYLSGPAPNAGWKNVQHPVMGYDNSMQYYPNAPKPMNPFEVTEGRSIAHTSSSPTLASTYGVLPDVSHRTGLMYTSSLGSLDTMVPYSASYASPVTGIFIVIFHYL
ncbi:probable ADP-ribosylation factor GTPase-activating protein AGD14 [Lathyrus oleraceus]|uniref:probable ADP-ribosylation factor GTPase-activating protein AGD14 n=1 Tax=Pisum sativum TaxID=3888 RepID=UPI0021CE518E|nr:probable ADP-ribosylation factor GTPase-activating protein AGD14 [Pisum sativum]